MKLLLTSNGLMDQDIIAALTDLVGKPPAETNMLFITTASSAAGGDKTWLIKDLTRVKDQGYAFLDILDFAALPRHVWQPRFEKADVMFFGGGNPYHLLDCLGRSGLAQLLPKLLEHRVYVGLSAGSSITGPSLAFSSRHDYYPEGMSPEQPPKALGLVPFCVRAHLNNPKFPHVTEYNLKEQAKTLNLPVHAIGDWTALKVVDDKVKVVGKSEHLYLPQN